MLSPIMLFRYAYLDVYIFQFKEQENKIIEKFKKLTQSSSRCADFYEKRIFFISNETSSEVEGTDISKLKTRISEIAKDRKYFVQKLPANWIELEQALIVLRKCQKNVLPWDDVTKCGLNLSIENTELERFLNYQHNIGKIIFFNEIRKYIILQPDWLVKCFRCILCDGYSFEGNVERRTNARHTPADTGQLTDDIIYNLSLIDPDLMTDGNKREFLLEVKKKLLFHKTSVDSNVQ